MQSFLYKGTFILILNIPLHFQLNQTKIVKIYYQEKLIFKT